jgi:hypothetical protein
MARFRLLHMSFLAACICATAATPASASEWPTARQFPLVGPTPPVYGATDPSDVVEDRDGSLLLSVYWPVVQTTQNSQTEVPQARLVRVARDGSRSYVRPFGKPGGRGPSAQIDDDILPLRDGSILFTTYNAVDRLRPDGSIVRFAGTGRYSENSSGDGGKATGADIGTPRGLSQFRDGSIVFAERHRVRRVAHGIITTIAGTGEYGFAGDNGPATAAQFRFPSDVLPTEDGGFLIADSFNNRVRRVSPDGKISTIVGAGKSDPLTSPTPFEGSGDGGPATDAELGLPAHLGRLPDGSLLIGERYDIRRVAPDGTISTIFRAQQIHGGRLGDFAGRYGDGIEGMAVTREGGVAVIVGGLRLRALYLAPRHTRRTLVALHGSYVSSRRVKVTVDATTRGVLQLDVRRHGKLVAHASRRVRAGRSTISVGRRFAAADHKVSVTLHADRGGAYSDSIHLFTGDTLPKRLAPSDVGDRCQRMGSRRIDCELHNPEDEESGVPCLNTVAFQLFRSGVVFVRPYGTACHHEPMPFERTPDWTGPWRAWPPS